MFLGLGVAGEAACRWARAVFFVQRSEHVMVFQLSSRTILLTTELLEVGIIVGLVQFVFSVCWVAHSAVGLARFCLRGARAFFCSTAVINDDGLFAQLVHHWGGLRFFVFAAAKGPLPSLNWVRAFVIRRLARAKISSSSVAFGFFCAAFCWSSAFGVFFWAFGRRFFRNFCLSGAKENPLLSSRG